MNEAFLQKLSQVEVLSLDVFDTTLGRRCANPEDVFILMEESLVRTHGAAFEGFGTARGDCDCAARRRAWENRQAEEILLEDIYSLLLEMHPQWNVPIQVLVDLELSVERRMLYPLEQANTMISAARAGGKKVIFISDMYLPEAFCREILGENGFNDYDHFFLSSTVGVLKHTGKLYQHAVDALGVAPDKILHVGDNPHSDIKQATKAGMQTHLLGKAIDKLENFPGNPLAGIVSKAKRWGKDSLLLGLSARGCLREESFEDSLWYRTGYQIGGPLLYGYVQFIINKIIGRGIEKVYFLSRDGYILKEVYERITAHLNGCPQADYLYASRRALNFCSITSLDEKTENWLAEGIHLTVGDFLKRIGLDPLPLAAEITRAGFTGPDQLVVEGRDYENLRQLYRCILPVILESAANERSIYLDYLREKGVFSARPFVLVDVGWMTSIQHSFSKILHPLLPDLYIEGYYIGTYPEAVQRAGPASLHRNYLMSYGAPPEALSIIRHCVCLVEFFFAAHEHTFLFMKKEGDAFVPQLASFHENEKDLSSLRAIHDGILEYVDQFCTATGEHPIKLDPSDILLLLKRFLAEPTAEEAQHLGEIDYADGYGSYFHHTCMARPSGLRKLGLSKRKWKKEFKRSHWPKGYYARLSALEKFIFRWMHPNHVFSKPYG